MKKLFVLIVAIILIAACGYAGDGRLMDTYDEFMAAHPGMQQEQYIIDIARVGYTQQNGVYVEAEFSLYGDEMYLTTIRVPFSGTIDRFVSASAPECVADIVVGSTTPEQVMGMPGVYYSREDEAPEGEKSGFIYVYEDGICWGVHWDTYGDHVLVDRVYLECILPAGAERLGMRGAESLDDFDDVVILTSTLEEVTAAHPDYRLHENGNSTILQYSLDDCSVLRYAFEPRDGEMLLTAARFELFADVLHMDESAYVYEDRVLTGSKDPEDFSMVHVGKTTFNELGAEYKNHVGMETSQVMFYLRDKDKNMLVMFFRDGPGYGVVSYAEASDSKAPLSSILLANGGQIYGEQLDALIEYLDECDIGY